MSSFGLKIIHLDLKGAPPKLSYLIQLFRLFKSIGANGILIEYEDTFPYSNELDCLRSKPSSYNDEEMKIILEAAIENQLTVIPLIQTFGHLEFVLKHNQFARLREVKRYPNSLCPTHKDSLKLITTILDQVVTLHRKYLGHHLKYIHIGCDEVWHLNQCSNCKSQCQTNGWQNGDLFLKHVSELARHVKDSYSLSSIIWDDMLRSIDLDTIKKFNCQTLIQPMVWHYGDNPDFVTIANKYFTNYTQLFDKIWIATAFKGASEINQLLPPAFFHINNHLAWINFLKNNQNIQIEGIALTGWQRFDHFTTLCELLPLSIPSLVLCLYTINYGAFTTEVHEKASSTLEFNNLIPLNSINYDSNSCTANFAGSSIFTLVLKLLKLNQEYKNLRNLASVKGGFTKYLIENNKTNPLHIDTFLLKLKVLIVNFEEMKKNLEYELSLIYNQETIDEWIDSHVSGKLVKLKYLFKNGEEQSLRE